MSAIADRADAGAAIIVYTTVGDEAAATTLADRLVDARLAACVQIVPRLRSVYRWDGRLRHDDESQLVIKTTAARYDAVAALLRDEHPYDLPEVVAVPVIGGSRAYLDWIAGEVDGAAERPSR